MRSVEVLISPEQRPLGLMTLNSAAEGARRIGLSVRVSRSYRGGSDWLCVYGAGEARRNAARAAQVAAGGHAVCWDLGYFGRDPNWSEKNYVRVSVDHHHPQAFIGRTPPRPERWAEQGFELRDDFDPDGPVIVIGMGPKSRLQLNLYDWEYRTLLVIRQRFPDRRVLYRPKRDRVGAIDWEQDATSGIEQLLRGASLVVCRHSNVAVDACIAGVPVECEDGAAHWLYSRGSDPSSDERLDFLRRLAWWQWRQMEMAEAWRFLETVINEHPTRRHTDQPGQWPA